MFKVEIPMAIKVNSEDTGQDLQKKIEKQMAVWKIERWKGEDHLSGPGIWLAKYANSLGLQSQSVAVVIVGLKNLKLAGHELI